MVLTNGPPTLEARPNRDNAADPATKTAEARSFLSPQSNSLQVGSDTFLSQTGAWESVRDQVVKPRWFGPLAGDGPHRAELVRGAKVFAGRDHDKLKPQQLYIADALNAPGISRFVFEAPRRSSKTASILYSILGRCLSRPGTLVTFAAQSGTDGRSAFESWLRELEQALPPEQLYNVFESRSRGYDQRPSAQDRQASRLDAKGAAFGGRPLFELPTSPDMPQQVAAQPVSSDAGFVVRKRAGAEEIKFNNGSHFQVLKPDASAFRGKAADIVWLDEMQELDPAVAGELLAGIVPLMDTRPDSRIIVSGTAGEMQAGALWDYLKRLRRGDPTMGGADWAADPLTPWAEIEDEDQAMTLVANTHPGVGTLTTIDKMRESYRDIPRPQWAREYLSLWPETSGDVVIPAELWTAARVRSRPRKPDHVALGLSVAYGGGSACLASAWRTSTGHAHIKIIEHRLGTKWIPDVVPDYVRELKTTLGVDASRDAAASITELERSSRRVRIDALNWQAMNAACVQFMRELERGDLRHQGQSMLNSAVENAAKRETTGATQAWLWKALPGGDITPLVAATAALRNWDTNHARRRPRTSSVITA